MGAELGASPAVSRMIGGFAPMLNDLACRRAVCAPGKAYSRFADSGGLYLEVSAAGGKSWRWKHRVRSPDDGRLIERRLTLGRYPEVSLAQARAARDEARVALRRGVDPAAGKRAEIAARVPVIVDPGRQFETLARRWWKGWAGNKNAKYAAQTLRRLEAGVFPDLGARDVGGLHAVDFVRCVQAIEAGGAPAVAGQVLASCGRVMAFAATQFRDVRNVVRDVARRDVFATRVVESHPHVGQEGLPDLVRAMDAYRGTQAASAALWLMAYTFLRTSELIGVRRREIDFDAGTLTIPVGRMKMRGGAHIVPLSAQARKWLLLLVDGYRQRYGEVPPDALLLHHRSDRARPMSNGTVLMALRRMGYAGLMTGHGFRHVASTALNEMGVRKDVIEAQLAHADSDKVRDAYNDAEYLAARRTMMQAWADHLDGFRR